ncbi:KRAB domain-containing zinc finger protein [Sarotherodon galilaeus]
MQWTCKYCTFCAEKRGYLFKHYRLKHGIHTQTSPLPCLFKDCLYTFKSFNALKVHLSVWHAQKDGGKGRKITFHCQLCDFVEPCNEVDFFTHLRRHLKLKQKVTILKLQPFKSNIYSTFNAHRSKEHKLDSEMIFKSEIVSENVSEEPRTNRPEDTVTVEPEDSDSDAADTAFGLTSDENVEDLERQLEHNVAALFLKMTSIFNISETALQDVIEQINQIHLLSQPLIHSSIQRILHQSDDYLVNEIVKVVTDNNAFLKCTSSGGSLSTTSKRTAYILREFPVVMPIEYTLKKDKHTFLYTILSNRDILDKAMSSESNVTQGYKSYKDSFRFKDNHLLTEEEFRIALCLYIDDFEVANPLGTSKRKHKLCAIYWVLGSLHPKYLCEEVQMLFFASSFDHHKYRLSLHSIQLALLCKVSYIKEYGYSEILHPLIQDLVSLEQHGVYVEQLGSSIKGTVLFVAADNLAAHSLGGFFESFTVSRMCRFCMAKREEIQLKEVRTRFNQELKKDSAMSQEYGVKGNCPLTVSLEHFHVVDGHPPDLLHDLLEGVVPLELALCLKGLVSKGYFTLEVLNAAIKQFPYAFSDRTNQPQLITKNFYSKRTIGGNGHENWTLLRLLPLLVGHRIPEGDETWEVLMNLKDVFLDCKIAEHRHLFQKVFPNETIRPKHHYIEHYPQLIQKFGPLSAVWTMRFEGKHKFFKEVVRHAHNFKNIALTLAMRHQKMMSFHLNAQQNTVLVASSACVHGIKYSADMVISVGSCSGLPDFRQITKIVVINTEILFVCRLMTSRYHEHFRAYELCGNHLSTVSVTELCELNDPFPLSLYKVKGRPLITLKRYILC